LVPTLSLSGRLLVVKINPEVAYIQQEDDTVVTSLKDYWATWMLRKRQITLKKKSEDGCLLAIALMMEAARTSETLVNFYQTTRR
jgi:hypothetical protein